MANEKISQLIQASEINDVDLLTTVQNGINKKIVNSDALKKILNDRGTITLSSNFPTISTVKIGWLYRITANVIDNDITKTNTGLSFIVGDEIYWQGTTWEILGKARAKQAEIDANSYTVDYALAKKGYDGITQLGYVPTVDSVGNLELEAIPISPDTITGSGTNGQVAIFNGIHSLNGQNTNTAFNQNFETDINNIIKAGIASVGISSNIPRSDHIHPSELVDQSNVWYFAPTGNDSNNGKCVEKAFLTPAAACTAASGGTLGQIQSVINFSAIKYTDSTPLITIYGNTLFNAPNCSFTTSTKTHTAQNGSIIKVKDLIRSGINACLSIGNTILEANSISNINANLDNGVINVNDNSIAFIKIDVANSQFKTLVKIGVNCTVFLEARLCNGIVQVGSGSKVHIVSQTLSNIQWTLEDATATWEVTPHISMDMYYALLAQNNPSQINPTATMNDVTQGVNQALSMAILARDSGMSIGNKSTYNTYAFDFIQFIWANIVNGNTVTITVDGVSAYTFTVASTGGGFNFSKGANATETATNFANCVNSNISAKIVASANNPASGYVRLNSVQGGGDGNNHLVSTNNTSGFIISAKSFIGGGNNTFDVPSYTVRLTKKDNDTGKLTLKEITLPAEYDVPIVTSSTGFTVLTIVPDVDLNIVQQDLGGGLFSNYTQNQTNPTLDPAIYKSLAYAGLAVHPLLPLGGSIETITDIGIFPPSDLGASFGDQTYMVDNGGTDLGTVTGGAIDLSFAQTPGILRRLEINPVDPIKPFERSISAGTLTKCYAVYRASGTWVQAYMYDPNNIQWNPNVYDDNSGSVPLIPINTYPTGSVLANKWHSILRFIIPGQYSIFLWGQDASYVAYPTDINIVINEINNTVLPPYLDKKYLASVTYIKQGVSNFSDNTKFFTYSYKQLQYAGFFNSSLPFSPFSYSSIVYADLYGNDGNSGASIEYPMTISGAVLKAKTMPTGTVVVCLTAGYINLSLTGSKSMTNGVNLFAPNAFITGTVDHGSVSTPSCIFGRNVDLTTITQTVFNAGCIITAIDSCSFTNIRFGTGIGGGYLIIRSHRFNTVTNGVIYPDAATSNHFLEIHTEAYGYLSASDTSLRNYIRIYADYTSNNGATLNYYNIHGRIVTFAKSLTITNCALQLRIDNYTALIDSGIAPNCTGSVSFGNWLVPQYAMPKNNSGLVVSLDALPHIDKKSYVNGGTATWFEIAVQESATDGANLNFDIYTALNTNPTEVSIINLYTLAGANGYIKAVYSEKQGYLAAIRPILRCYTDTTNKVHVYMKAAASVNFTIYYHNQNYDSSKFLTSFNTSGTGTDPTGVSSYVLNFDSSNYTSSQSITWNSGIFNGGSVISKINFGKPFGNCVPVSFIGFSTTSAIASNQTITMSGTLPTAIIPEFTCSGIFNISINNVIFLAEISISNLGLVKITKQDGTGFSTSGTGQPINISSCSINIPIKNI